jgi:hypothetical protein
MRARQEEWAKRVERWRDSGLTAEQFASELGVNVGTLRYWKYKLAKTPAERARATPGPLPLVELPRPQRAPATDAGLIVELARGRSIRVPAAFDTDALKRLLAVLEST